MTTLYGWDASDFDWPRGSMDLAAARAAGISFFTHKATEGTSVRHVHYGEALRRARAAAMPFTGAYHVVRSGPTSADQVSYLLAYADEATPWWRDYPGWFWQVDLEKWPYDAVPAWKGEEFADILAARTGRAVLMYASKGQYGDSLAGTCHPLWNANYGSNASGTFQALYAARGGDTGAGWASYSGRTPVIWQYGSQAIIGTQHTCDANAFRGTIADFARLIGMEDDVNLTDHIGNTQTPQVTAGRDVEQILSDVWNNIHGIGRGEITPSDPRYPAPGTPARAALELPAAVGQLKAKVEALAAGQVDPDALKAAVKACLQDADVVGPLVKAIGDALAARLAQ